MSLHSKPKYTITIHCYEIEERIIDEKNYDTPSHK